MKLGLDFCDVLMIPCKSDVDSRANVMLERTFTFRNGNTWTTLPIVAANMDTVGTFSMARAFQSTNASVALHKHYPIEEYVKNIPTTPNNVFYTTGIQDEDRETTTRILESEELKEIGFNKLMIDTPNGYISKMIKTVEYYRKTYPNMIICAGNVASPEGVKMLADAGADIVKIGIGSGKLCNTRLKAGVGYPQFSLIQECVENNTSDVYLMSDGGINNPGDAAKAFGAGADFVMIGTMFAGHAESETETYMSDNHREYTVIYGMSSSTAMDKYHGGVASHRTCEGRTMSVKFKGDVVDCLKDLCGGLRSAGTYLGASRIQDFSLTSSFIQVNRQVNH